MPLSEHYTLEEMCCYPSEFDDEEGFENEPDSSSIKNLTRIAHILEKAYPKFGKLQILSGYRSLCYDALYCGVENPSNHIYGKCVDIKVKRKDKSTLVSFFSSSPEVDSVQEYKGGRQSWLHIEIK